MNFPFILRVRDEPVGIAYGSENWFKAQDFLRIPTLPGWITDDVWKSLIAAKQRLEIEVPIHEIARGTTGCGEDGVFD